MTPAQGTDLLAKFVEAVKDLPAWLLTALAVAAGLLLFVPQINSELPKDYRPWLVVSVVLFGLLAVFKWINVLVAAWRAGRIEAKARKIFYMTPNSGTLMNTLRRGRSVVMPLKKRSIMFNHDAEDGVKCMLNRGCLTSHSCTTVLVTPRPQFDSRSQSGALGRAR